MKKTCLILMLFITATINQSLFCTNEKSAVFIIGTGRSGTSCTAFTLKTLGIPMGNNLGGPNQFNVKGNFEDIHTVNFNKQILQAVQRDNRSIRFFKWLEHPQYFNFVQQVKNHLKKHFGQFDRFCIKNPQISYMLPLYLPACEELGYTPKLIIVTRNPEEIAASFSRRTGLPPATYYPEICDCYKSIMTYGYGYEWLVIDYKDLLKNLEPTVEKIRNFIPGLKTFNEVEATLTNFFDPNLQHHNYASE